MSSRRKTQERGRGWLVPLAGAVIAGAALTGLDLVGSGFWAEHPMLAQTVGGAILFVQGGLLLPSLLTYRDEQRQRRVSQMAYATLAQAVNDAGRRLLAPLNGADLYALGIDVDDREPGSGESITAINQGRLARHSFEPLALEASGTWGVSRSSLEGRLEALLDDQEFVRFFFRRVSRVRRDLQASAAIWAPTMFSNAERTEDLDEYRELIWDVQQLQRALRSSGVLLTEAPQWTPTEAFVASVTSLYWRVVERYEKIVDDFDEKGVHERSGRAA